MKFKELRNSENQSDLTVSVDDENFKLHKLPLCAKSNYFKEHYGTNSECQLENFPGGAEVFSLIADYCYDDTVQMDPFNLVEMYFGAKQLEMVGDNNLVESTKQQLRKSCDDAKRKRGYLPAIAVLCTAYSMDDPEAEKIREDAFKALEFALYGSIGSDEESEQYRYRTRSSYLEDNHLITDYLVFLPLEHVTRLVQNIGLEGPDKQAMYRFIYKYLGRVLDHNLAEKQLSKEESSQDIEPQAGEQSTKPPKEIPMICQPSAQLPREEQQKLVALYEKTPQLHSTLEKPLEHFDALFYLIPEENPLSDIVTVAWIKEAITLVENSPTEPKCREKILYLAQKMLQKFSKQEVGMFDSSTMSDILAAGSSSNPEEEITKSSSETQNTEKAQAKESKSPGLIPMSAIRTIIEYMDEKADEDQLTTDDYLKMVGKLTLEDNDRKSHDGLIKVLLKVCRTGRELTDQEKSDLLDRVKLSNCSTETLAQALEDDILPPKSVAEAALEMAKKCPNLTQVTSLENALVPAKLASTSFFTFVEPYQFKPTYSPDKYKAGYELSTLPMSTYQPSSVSAYKSPSHEKCPCGRSLWPTVYEPTLASDTRYYNSPSTKPTYKAAYNSLSSAAVPSYMTEHNCTKYNRSSATPMAYYSFNTHNFHHSCCCCCRRSGRC